MPYYRKQPYYKKKRSYYKKRSYKPRASSSSQGLSRYTKKFVNELARESKAGPYIPLTSPLEGYTKALSIFGISRSPGTSMDLGSPKTYVLNSILTPDPDDVGIKAYGISEHFNATDFSRAVVTGYKVVIEAVNVTSYPCTLWIRRYIGTPSTILPDDSLEALQLQEEARSGQFQRHDLGTVNGQQNKKTIVISGNPAKDWGLNDSEWLSNVSAQEAITSSSTTPVSTSHQIRMSMAISRIPSMTTTTEPPHVSITVKLYQTVRLFRQEADQVIE